MSFRLRCYLNLHQIAPNSLKHRRTPGRSPFHSEKYIHTWFYQQNPSVQLYLPTLAIFQNQACQFHTPKCHDLLPDTNGSPIRPVRFPVPLQQVKPTASGRSFQALLVSDRLRSVQSSIRLNLPLRRPDCTLSHLSAG